MCCIPDQDYRKNYFYHSCQRTDFCRRSAPQFDILSQFCGKEQYHDLDSTFYTNFSSPRRNRIIAKWATWTCKRRGCYNVTITYSSKRRTCEFFKCAAKQREGREWRLPEGPKTVVFILQEKSFSLGRVSAGLRAGSYGKLSYSSAMYPVKAPWKYLRRQEIEIDKGNLNAGWLLWKYSTIPRNVFLIFHHNNKSYYSETIVSGDKCIQSGYNWALVRLPLQLRTLVIFHVLFLLLQTKNGDGRHLNYFVRSVYTSCFRNKSYWSKKGFILNCLYYHFDLRQTVFICFLHLREP